MSQRWGKTFVAESEKYPQYIDRSVEDIGADEGKHPLDVMCDISLTEDLATRYRMILANDDEDDIGLALARTDAVLGLSDAGAHASQLCDAGFTSLLLGHWVRDRKALSLEAAVWRLTGNPAAVFRIPERGRIIEGYVADLVAFDPDTIAMEPLQRVYDLPAGADRLITRSTGIEHVWVSGEPVRRDGIDVDDARPGRLLRSRVGDDDKIPAGTASW
jgi:N-acyl-D-aspartate/D-glutamate deacylase